MNNILCAYRLSILPRLNEAIRTKHIEKQEIPIVKETRNYIYLINDCCDTTDYSKKIGVEELNRTIMKGSVINNSLHYFTKKENDNSVYIKGVLLDVAQLYIKQVKNAYDELLLKLPNVELKIYPYE